MKLSIRVISQACRTAGILVFLGALIGGVDGAPESPPSLPPPPPPLTKAPDPNQRLLNILSANFPGREWSQVSVGPDGNSFTAEYVLTEPEYIRFEKYTAPGGQNLQAILGIKGVYFAVPARPAGAKGKFAAAGVVNTGYSRSFSGPKDTPADPGAKIGLPKSGGDYPGRQFLDVTSDFFVTQYPKWVSRRAQFEAIASAAVWEGTASYPQAQIGMRCRIESHTIAFEDKSGRLLGRSGTSGFYVLEEQGNDSDVVFMCDLNDSPEAPIFVEEYIKKHPRVFDQSEAAAPQIPFFLHCRVKMIDPRTLQISAIGLPETIFRRVR